MLADYNFMPLLSYMDPNGLPALLQQQRVTHATVFAPAQLCPLFRRILHPSSTVVALTAEDLAPPP
eukprot:SAG11_NODE_20212_length_450_cov_1.005698_1_plen_65_part_10